MTYSPGADLYRCGGAVGMLLVERHPACGAQHDLVAHRVHFPTHPLNQYCAPLVPIKIELGQECIRPSSLRKGLLL